MPLFRSNSSGNATSHRSDLDRQTGCIAGFFQIFDPQVRAKQIAGPPQKEAATQVEVVAAPQPPPPSAESCTSSMPVVLDATSTCGTECGDACKVAKGDTKASSELCFGDGELQSVGSFQSTNASSHDSNPSQQEKLQRHPAKVAAHVREEPAKASTMVKHSSFKDRDYHIDHEIAFSPRRGNVAAYAAGGRRFNTNGSINACEDNRAVPSEDERWGCWSSPASNWPSVETIQEPEPDVVAGGRKSAWLSKGGWAAERQWAAEDSLEEWKQSLRALARLKEDEEAGVYRNNSGLIAPKVSPRAMGNELPPTSPARVSAFDFKEAIRWSQRTSSQVETSARRSWDDRDLPRSIAELRDAINARSHAISAASPPPSPRPPSVIARLMGLDNLPQQQQAPLVSTIERKPSGEAKLLQQLLQCSPPPTHSPLPLSSAARAQHRRAGVKNVVEYPVMPASPNRDTSSRSELQSMLKHIEAMSQHGGSNTSSNAKPLGTMSRYSKSYENEEPCSAQSFPVKKSNHQNYLPVVVLKQSEEIRSPSRASHGYHDEIERRLRQLGLQSSEQERKTLKQILEAMQHKGLLKPPDGARSANGTRRQHALSSGSSFVTSGHSSPAHTSLSGAAMWPSPPIAKPVAVLNVSSTRNAKRDESASIVIMRPLAKSANRATANVETQLLVSERAHATSASRAEKITPRKRKNAVKIENSTVKESTSSRSKSRPLSTSELEPASLHIPIQTRKHSLKLRQGQVHVAKGSSRPAPSEQVRKSNDLSTLRRRSRELVALSSDRAKPISVVENEMESCAPDEAIYGDVSDVCVSDDMQKASECPSDGSLGDPFSQETTMEDEMGIATPPREVKMDGRFGGMEGCFVKEVEQCSPVSVLDIVHLSNNEMVESPDELEDEGGLRDYQVNINICNPLLEDIRFPTKIAQPADLEIHSQKMVMDAVDEAHTCNVELADANEPNLLSSPEIAHTISNKEDVLPHELNCHCSNDDVAAADEQDCNKASSAIKEHIQGNDSEDCLHMNEDGHTSIEDAYATDNMNPCSRVMSIENGSNLPPCNSDVLSCACISKDAIDEDMLLESHGSNGEEMDDTWTSNVEFCYAEDVLRGAGVVVGPGEGWCMAEGWLGGGGKMGRAVYEELEEQWDVLEEEDGCIEDRDMGGELYRKSQQAAMRRRLLFDCVNEILERRFSWVGIPGARGGHRGSSVVTVCGDLQRLEEGPRSAEDSMYAMLEQDLLHDADYSIPQCWNGLPTQLASVALQLEQDILDSLVLEVLPQAPHC